MDYGGSGHILVSRHVAEDFEHYPRWQPYLHPLGDFEVKHGQVISVVNFYNHDVGNPVVPAKLGKNASTGTTATAVKSWRPYLIAAMAIGAIIIAAAIVLLFKFGRNEIGGATSLASIPEKSIAVLPFQTLTDDKSHA